MSAKPKRRKPKNLMEAVLMAKPNPPMKRIEVWTWGDPDDELHRYGNTMLYKTRPHDAPASRRAVITVSVSTPPRKPRRKP